MAVIATPTQLDRYEYKFVRIGEYRGSALFGVRDKDRDTYREIISEHACEGWRLVQISRPAPLPSVPPGTTS